MKKCYLDSNFLVYIKNEQSPYHKKASSLLSELVFNGVSLYISSLVLDEFLHSFYQELRQVKVKTIFADLQRALGEILRIPLLSLVSPPLESGIQMEVVHFMEKYHLRARDGYHLLIMLHNKIDSFATFDSDFKKVFANKLLTKI